MDTRPAADKPGESHCWALQMFRVSFLQCLNMLFQVQSNHRPMELCKTALGVKPTDTTNRATQGWAGVAQMLSDRRTGPGPPTTRLCLWGRSRQPGHCQQTGTTDFFLLIIHFPGGLQAPRSATWARKHLQSFCQVLAAESSFPCKAPQLLHKSFRAGNYAPPVSAFPSVWCPALAARAGGMGSTSTQIIPTQLITV